MANVETTITGGIAHVKLNRPEKLNGLTLPMLGELVAAAHHVRRNKGVRAVVISGEGRSFCAGLDFGELMAKPVKIVPVFLPRPWRGTNTFQEACWAWRRVPVPVIVAVHGHCYGGGLLLALACDERCARAERGFLCLPETSIGVPFTSGLAALVSARLAPREVHRAMILSERYDAPAAVAAGIVDDAVPGADLLAHAVRRAGELSRLRGSALSANKRRRYAEAVEALHRPEQLTVETEA